MVVMRIPPITMQSALRHQCGGRIIGDVSSVARWRSMSFSSDGGLRSNRVDVNNHLSFSSRHPGFIQEIRTFPSTSEIRKAVDLVITTQSTLTDGGKTFDQGRVDKGYGVIRLHVDKSQDATHSDRVSMQKHILTIREILHLAESKEDFIKDKQMRGKRELLTARDLSSLSLIPRYEYPANRTGIRVSFDDDNVGTDRNAENKKAKKKEENGADNPGLDVLKCGLQFRKFAGEDSIVYGLQDAVLYKKKTAKEADVNTDKSTERSCSSGRLILGSMMGEEAPPPSSQLLALQSKAIRFAQTRRLGPQLWLRGKCMIAAFGNTQCLIWHDEAIIFDADLDSTQTFVREYLIPTLEHRLHISDVEHKTGDETLGRKQANTKASEKMDENMSSFHDVESDFDYLLLESVLSEVCESWERRLLFYRPLVVNLLNLLSNDTHGYASSAELSVAQLLPLKNSLSGFELQLREMIACLEQILDDDDLMVSMLLSEQHRWGKTDARLREAMELMLDEHKRTLNTVLTEVIYLQRKIQAKQELAKLSMDAYRNNILKMSMDVAVVSLGLAFPTLSAGIMGMNLVHGFEENPVAFGWTVISSSIVGAAISFGLTLHVRGYWRKKGYEKRVKELKALRAILGDISALDRAVKQMLNGSSQAHRTPSDGPGFAKEEFRKLFTQTSGRRIKDEEIDLLFDVFDDNKSGNLDQGELRQYFARKKDQ